MWHSSLADMFDDHLHLRIVGETSILLLEPEMRRVKMHNKRWRTVRVFLKNVGRGFDCNDNERTESVHQYVLRRHCGIISRIRHTVWLGTPFPSPVIIPKRACPRHPPCHSCGWISGSLRHNSGPVQGTLGAIHHIEHTVGEIGPGAGRHAPRKARGSGGWRR
jgi:hypothetical protein